MSNSDETGIAAYGPRSSDKSQLTTTPEQPRPAALDPATEIVTPSAASAFWNANTPKKDVIGGYTIESVLGRGGMGTVYLGKHEILGRLAAIKVLAPELTENESHVSRFFQEAKIVNDVQHPNIVQIIDFVRTQEPPRVAFIMEYLQGRSLSDALSEGEGLSVMQAIHICYQLCDGLAAIHESGVIHRDLKPDNIFLIGEQSANFSYVPSVKIFDFGIAKHLNTQPAHQTATGTVMGTPAYMAPEQIAGEAPSTKSDVYALASIFYEMLTSERLFTGNAIGILKRKLLMESCSLEGLEGLKDHARFVALIDWGLTQDPKLRPTMANFARGLMSLRAETNETLMSLRTAFFKPKELIKTPLGSRLLPALEAAPLIEKSAADGRWRWIAGGIAVWACAALLFWGVSDRKEISQVKAIETSTPTVAKPRAASPAKSLETVRYSRRIQTRPRRARVLDAKSKRILGYTPFSVIIPSGETRQVIIQKSGYFGVRRVIKAEQDLPTIYLKRRPKVNTNSATPDPQTAEEASDNDAPFSKREVPTW